MINAHTLPNKLYKAEQVRSMDEYAIQTLNIPGFVLMQRAGLAAFNAMRSRWPEYKTISILCGSGNNAGDGYVLATLALQAKMDVKIYSLSDVSNLKNDALKAFEGYKNAGGETLDFVPADFEGAEILVDALLGTGLTREVTGLYLKVIQAMNRFKGKVLAIDIPSGLNANTGCALGASVRADLTVTFIGLKQGLFTADGLACSGEIVFDNLDTPIEVQRSQMQSAERISNWRTEIKPRLKNSHKGHFGHVLIIGGTIGFSGAALLAASASLRVGAGLVSIATHPNHAALLNLSRPELMCHGIDSSLDLNPLFDKAGVIAIGPGLGQSAWSKTLWQAALESGLPLVVDADALNLLADQPIRRDDWILTPHPGEAARLLKIKTADVQSDRFSAIQAIQERFGGSILLKGSGTLILSEQGLPKISTAGNPGMASGGMGDVLTGVIAGLWAQGYSRIDAARLGVCIHGAAGDMAASDGEIGLLANDLMDPLRKLMNGYEPI